MTMNIRLERRRRRGVRHCRGVDQLQEHGTTGIITDAPSHDERVIAARDEFMDVNNEEVSDEDGCLSRSMTIKTHRRILRERSMISRVASEVSFQLLYSDTGASLREERVITVRK